jgi:HK97 family phage prohead protease
VVVRVIPQRLLDVDGVREHLSREIRLWATPLEGTRSEVRANTEGESDALILEGYAAVFDSDSLPICGMFVERIKRGAFKNVLSSKPDMRLLVNHDGLPFARTSNGTLEVSEKPQGLHYRATLAPTVASQELHTLVARGDVDQNSFAFRVAKGGDTWDCECGDTFGEECRCTGEALIRTITDVSECPEVSVVTFPAYPATSVTVARENEAPGERHAQASDEEQRDTALDGDASTMVDAGDPKQRQRKRRALMAAVERREFKGNTNESRTVRSASAHRRRNEGPLR